MDVVKNFSKSKWSGVMVLNHSKDSLTCNEDVSAKNVEKTRMAGENLSKLE